MDEDTLGDYIYADYDAGNGLLDGPLLSDNREPERQEYGPPPSRVRVPQPPKRPQTSYQDFRSRPGGNNGGGLGLRGRDACQSGAKTVGHEEQCDLYYECYEGQGFLTSCPNGLMYGGEGRFGLLGNCDYPHNVNCQGREGKSKPNNSWILSMIIIQCMLHDKCLCIVDDRIDDKKDFFETIREGQVMLL